MSLGGPVFPGLTLPSQPAPKREELYHLQLFLRTCFQGHRVEEAGGGDFLRRPTYT